MRRIFGPALLCLAACTGDIEQGPSPVPPPTFSVTPDKAWAGTPATVRSSLFADQSQHPAIKVGGVDVETTRVDDSTLSFIIPATAGQHTAVAVINGFAGYVAGTIEVAGFRARREATAALGTEPILIPSADGQVALAASGTGLGVMPVRTGETRILPGVAPIASGHGVGLLGPATGNGSFLALRDSTGQVGVWFVDRIEPVLVFQSPVPSPGFAYSNAYPLDNRPTFAFARDQELVIQSTGLPDLSVALPDAHLPQAGASGALFRTGAGVSGGVPVLWRINGQPWSVVGHLPVETVDASVVTNDNAHFVVGHNEGPTRFLVVARRVLSSDHPPFPYAVKDTLPSVDEVVAMGRSGEAGRIYVAALKNGQPQILVYDGASLGLVAQLSAPAGMGCECASLADHAGLAVDGDTHTLYLIGTGQPTRIWEFDILDELDIGIAGRAATPGP